MFIELIKINDIVVQTKRSKAMIYKDIGEDLFPEPIHLGGDNTRGSYLPAEEVNAVILARGAGYDDAQTRKLVRKLKEQRKERLSELLNAIGA